MISHLRIYAPTIVLLLWAVFIVAFGRSDGSVAAWLVVVAASLLLHCLERGRPRA